jgi:hypothetical protein
MPKYDVRVVVEYMYEVEADSEEAAEAEGWNYEDYAHHGQVDSIDVDEIPEEDEEDDD